ncbi:MAG: hypothetical protein H0W30_01285 [Gemmatimonadaceae bacterium]|nr:hypothetical protein [Gemmatimonadaceae bacterium]
MTMTIGPDDAGGVLGPERMAMLRGCIERAWATYDSTFRPALPLCSAIGIANILHELIIEQVRNTFGGVPGVEVRDSIVKGRFLLEIDRAQILQFKKFTENFQTSNNPTGTSVAFDNQQTIEGMPELPRLTVGYQLGQYGTALAGMWLAFCIGRENIWHIDLQTGVSSLPLEFPALDESAAKKEREAKRKKAAEEAAKKKRKRVIGDDHDDDGAPSVA